MDPAAAHQVLGGGAARAQRSPNKENPRIPRGAGRSKARPCSAIPPPRTSPRSITPAWPVRYLCRPHQHELRAAAWHNLGLAARAAFNASDQFAPLLLAIANALKELT